MGKDASTPRGRLFRQKSTERILGPFDLGGIPVEHHRLIFAVFRLDHLCVYYPYFPRNASLGRVSPPDQKVKRVHWLAYNHARWVVMRWVKDTHGKPLIAKHYRELIGLQLRALAFRDAILNLNLGLAHKFAKQLARDHNDQDDAISVGLLATVDAIERFDVDRGWQFSSYASRAIVRAVLRNLERKRQREELTATDVPDDAAAPCESTVEDAAHAREVVAAAMPALSEREARVIRLRFGLGREEPVTLREIGKRLGVSVQRAEQIQQAATAKMARATKSSPEHPAA